MTSVAIRRAPLFVVSIVLLSAAQRLVAADALTLYVGEPTPDDIRAWINQLDSEDFVSRELATLALVQSGRAGIRDVADSAHDDSAEVRQRSFDILRRIYESDDLAVSQLAQAELIKLVDYGHPGVAAALRVRSVAAVRELQSQLISKPGPDRQICSQVTGAIKTEPGRPENVVGISLCVEEDLGCGCCYGTIESGLSDSDIRHLVFLGDLRSIDLQASDISDAGLSHLSRLKNLRTVNVSSNRITDAGVADLRKLPNLNRLHIGGKQITSEGIAVLKRAMPNCKISQYTSLW